MGFLKSGTTAQAEALTETADPSLDAIREAARGAQLANRKTFVARLPLPSDAAVGDVPLWSSALQQIGQYDWSLAQWSVCPEPEGPVAYAVFTR